MIQNTTQLTLPNGNNLNIRVPTTPNKNTRDYMIDVCKFHIPLHRVEQQITKKLWPTTKINSQPHGKNSIPEENLWTGSEKELRQLLRTQEVEKINKRARKLRAIRKAKTALSKITSDEWDALKTIFLIQPKFQ